MTLLSSGVDGTFRVWDLKALKEIGEPMISETGDINGMRKMNTEDEIIMFSSYSI